MEESQKFENLVIIGSIVLVVIVIAFIAHVISERRKRNTLLGIIEILKAQNSTRIETNTADIQNLKKEIEKLKQSSANPEK